MDDPFAEELTNRVRTMKHNLKNENLDAYIITSQDSLFYFTGLSYKPEERAFFLIISENRKPVFLSPKLEEKHLSKITIECEIIAYWEVTSSKGENWYDILKDIIKPYKRVGVEESIPYSILNRIEGNEIVCLNLVDEMRKVKTPYEIGMIRSTSSFADIEMKNIFKNAYIGASVLEMFSLSSSVQKQLIRQKNFDPVETSLTSAVWPSPISSMPHCIPGLKDRLTRGSNVAMVYFKVNGYAAECERTFFLDRPSDQETKYFNDMMEARNIALSLVKPGIKCLDIDIAVREYLIKHGYENNLLHRTGHGIGLSNHEMPFISLGYDEVLKENMVISIEPGIYIDDFAGYRHSDTVLVTEKGYELLTKFPTDITSMTISNGSLKARGKGEVIKKLYGI